MQTLIKSICLSCGSLKFHFILRIQRKMLYFSLQSEYNLLPWANPIVSIFLCLQYLWISSWCYLPFASFVSHLHHFFVFLQLHILFGIWRWNQDKRLNFLYLIRLMIFNTYTARPVCWREWLKTLMLGHGGSSAGSYLADPTSPSPRTVLSLSCFKVSQCINCRDWHFKS